MNIRLHISLFSLISVLASLGCDKETRRNSRGERIEIKQQNWIDKVTSYVDGTGPEARAAISGEAFKIPPVLAPKIHSLTMFQNVAMLCKKTTSWLSQTVRYDHRTDKFAILLKEKMNFNEAKLACETYPSGGVPMKLATSRELGSLVSFVQGPIESENMGSNYKNSGTKQDSSQKLSPTIFVCPLLVHAGSDKPNEHSLYLFGGSSPDIEGQTSDTSGAHNAICIGSV